MKCQQFISQFQYGLLRNKAGSSILRGPNQLLWRCLGGIDITDQETTLTGRETQSQKMNNVVYSSSKSLLPNFQTYRRHYRALDFSHPSFCRHSSHDTTHFNLTKRHYTERSSSSPKLSTKDTEKQTSETKENIWTIPNLLTFSRIISTPILGYMVTIHSFEWGLGLFVFAGVTDLLDGFIARTFPSQRTAFGTHLDPLADKLLISVLTITLTVVHLLPVWLTALIVIRDAALIGAVFYVRFVSLSPPRTLSRFFNVSMPSAQLYPSTISKFNTALQLSLVALTLAAPVFDYVNHPALQTLWYVTALTTFISSWGYMKNGWSHVKILNKSTGT